jgi:Arc/MetJ-type ribon-helix-helix transcriptional regulator
MSTDRQLVVTLPAELADMVHRKIASGEYADENAVIVDSLTLLQDQKQRMERWLREEVVPACTAFEKNPSAGISASELLAHLDAARRDRQRSA